MNIQNRTTPEKPSKIAEKRHFRGALLLEQDTGIEPVTKSLEAAKTLDFFYALAYSLANVGFLTRILRSYCTTFALLFCGY